MPTDIGEQGDGKPAAPLPAQTVIVWDPLVRITHWSLVATVVVAYFSPAGRSLIHETAGYAAAAIVALRLVWGWVGTPYARFSQFAAGPAALLAYLGAMLQRREPRVVGHNPAGAAMIVVLLALLTAICVSGWLLTRQTLRDHRILQEWHGRLSDGLMIAAVLHVLGVLYASIRHRENLLWSMFTGRKRS